MNGAVVRSKFKTGEGAIFRAREIAATPGVSDDISFLIFQNLTEWARVTKRGVEWLDDVEIYHSSDEFWFDQPVGKNETHQD